MLCNKGFLCYITPYTFISGIYFSKFRNYIKHLSLKKIIVLGKKVFEAAEVDTSIMLLEKDKSKCEVAIADLRDRTSYIDFFNISYFYVSHDRFFCKSEEILFIVPEKEIELYLHLYEDSDCLIGSLIHFYHGIQTRGNSKALTDTYKKGVIPIIKGADFNKYVLPIVSTYIHFIKENVKSGGDIKYYDVDKKLLIRTTADKIIASIDYNHYFALNSVNVGVPINNYVSLEFLLAVLNSKLMEYWYRLTVQERNKTFAEVKIVYLERIPIKYNKILQEQIVSYVSELLSIKCLTGIYNNIKIENVEKKINSLIYKLYNLTYDEVLLVDPQVTITREEYERTKLE